MAEDVVAVCVLGSRTTVVPNQAGALINRRLGVKIVVDWRDVAGLGDIDAPQVADLGTVIIRLLPHAHVNLIVMHHGGSQKERLRPLATGLVRGRRLGVAIELPNKLPGFGVQTPQPAVSSRKDYLRLAVDLGIRGVRPLTVDDVASLRIILPKNLASLLVNCDEAGCLRGRDFSILVSA